MTTATLTQVYDGLRSVGLPLLGTGLNEAVYAMGAKACGIGITADASALVICQDAINQIAEQITPLLLAGSPPSPSLEPARAPGVAPEDGMLMVDVITLAYLQATFDYMKSVIAATGLPLVTDGELGERLSPPGMLPLVRFADASAGVELVTYTPPDWYNTWLADVAKMTDASIDLDTKEVIARDNIIADAQLWSDSYLPIARDVVLLDRIAFAFATAAVGSQVTSVPVARKKSSGGFGWLLAAAAAAIALAKAKAFG